MTEVRFWNTSIALYRGADGRLFALENRCAHRQLKLSLGHVDGCNLTCVYHGWSYDGAGKVVGIPHDLFGKSTLKVQVRSYPVQARHGLIWIFPGDPRRGRRTFASRYPRTGMLPSMGVRSHRFHVAGPSLHDLRKHYRLHPRLPAPALPAVCRRPA